MSVYEKCPNCNHTIPVNEGFITWCDKCLWNINPDVYSLRKKNIFDSVYEKAGKVSKDKLFNEVIKMDEMKHRVTVYTVLAYIVSAFVYSTSLFFIYYAIRTIFFVGGAPHNYAIAFILLLFGIELLPRFPKVKGQVLERHEFPALYKLIDMIAEKLQCKRIEYLYINAGFNAYFTVSGLKKESCIVIGVPYFSILDINEKVSVLAHETAHHMGRDASRNRFVSLAMSALSKWYDQLLYYGNTIVLLPITWPISIVVKMLVYVLGGMVWRDRQKAEYIADYHAARTAGVESVISASEKFYFHPAFPKALEQVSRYKNSSDLFESFRKRIDNIPEREIQRVKTIEDLETKKPSSSHPPTLLRNQFVLEKVINPDSIHLSQEDVEKIEDEFKKAEYTVQKILLDDYKEYFI